MKKLVSLVIVMALVLSLAVGAAAEEAATPNYTITVNSANEGETYSAYKMLDLSVDNETNPTSYRYTVNSDWATYFTAGTPTKAWETVFSIDAQGYVTAKDGIASETTWNANTAMSKFAEEAAKFAKDNNITAKVTDKPTSGETSATLTTTEPGYYLITSTLGTRAMVDTTPSSAAVTINEKNAENTVTKTVKEDSTSQYGDSNNAQLGDTIEFSSTVTIVPRSVNVVIHDAMDSALTYTANSLKIYTDKNHTSELNDSYYTINTTPDTGDTFTIKIQDTFAATATDSQTLYITYSATLNASAITESKAIKDKITNTMNVSFGDASEATAASTNTTTHKFEVLKFAKNDSEKKNLAGAVFQLKKDDSIVNLYKLDGTNYRVATETTTASSHVDNNNALTTVAINTVVSDFVTVDSGNIVIWGVDADSDYTLTEIKAPDGYNKLTAATSVAVAAENNTTIEIENATGAELPSTGGVGTTIFYALGGLMFVGALVLLVTNKRMKAE